MVVAALATMVAAALATMVAALAIRPGLSAVSVLAMMLAELLVSVPVSVLRWAPAWA